MLGQVRHDESGHNAASICHTLLNRVHIGIAQSKMMPDLVDHDMPDQFFQPHTGLHHLSQQRAAVEENPVPLPAWRRKKRLLTHRHALIEAGQLIGADHAEMIQYVLRRPILHAQHDIGEMFRERRRDREEHAPGDGFEVGYGGWVGHVFEIGIAGRE